MTAPKQLQLLNQPPSPQALSPRYQAVLHALQAAGHEGIDARQAGAIDHSLRPANPHPADKRCDTCERDGNKILRSLRKKGYAKYRLRTGWVAVTPTDVLPPGMTNEIPY